jgi:RES domain-containing protein
MTDLGAFFRSAPLSEFSGTVYRVCPARYAGNLVSMRGAFLHGARYNIRGYFGALYTSLSPQTARREMARYFTVPPIGGFVEASIGLRLSRVVDLTNRALWRKARIAGERLAGERIAWERLSEPRFSLTQELGLRAWENGIEGLIVPSAADQTERNLAVFLDNQHPLWLVELTTIAAGK